MRRNFLATPFAFSLALPFCAAAQDQSDAEQTRTEFEELRQRMQELENRLDQQSKAETAQGATPAPFAREPAPVPECVSSSAVRLESIDLHRSGFFTAGIPGQRLNAEQACTQNNGSVPGVVDKAERFFSGFDCINQQSPHAYQSASSCG